MWGFDLLMDVDLGLGLIDLSSCLVQGTDDAVAAGVGEQDLVECGPQKKVCQGGRGQRAVPAQGGLGGIRGVQALARRAACRVGNQEMKLIDIVNGKSMFVCRAAGMVGNQEMNLEVNFNSTLCFTFGCLPRYLSQVQSVFVL
jgi:hypothetical protein